MAQSIGVVCCYSPEANDTNKQYWDFVIRRCNKGHFDILFLSGGFTRGKSMPNVSEAAAACEYIRPRLKSEVHIIGEEDSYTTWDNLQNVAARAKESKLISPDNSFTFFCHTSKKFLIEKLAVYFFGRDISILVESTYWKMGLIDNVLQPIVTLGMLSARRWPSIADTWRRIQMSRYAKM
ncbi:MAG TPA: hypothetical protein VIJ29_04275 [Candidatus Paceibacterota bacterium]